jgi:hypothetical protein
MPGQLVLLGLALLDGQLAGVAALAGCGDPRGQLDERGPERLDLDLGGGPDVIPAHHRAEPPGGADGLQAGHPGPED